MPGDELILHITLQMWKICFMDFTFKKRLLCSFLRRPTIPESENQVKVALALYIYSYTNSNTDHPLHVHIVSALIVIPEYQNDARCDRNLFVNAF